MNAGVFTTLFIILVLIVVFFTVHEGFQQPVLHIPESPVKQKNLVEKAQEDYASSYVLAAGPAPGAIASFNSLPYRDPSLEKAKYERILNVQTTLEEFLRNEASNIEELSDPSIQLPLTSARADLTKLKSEIMVLKRNPGIDSSLTQSDVDEIQANLGYLQKKYRLSIYNDTSEYEGFQDSSGATISDSSGPTISDSSGATPIIPKVTSPPITIKELRDLINKIDVTKARLTMSGTTDPVVLTRVSVLDKIKGKVQEILNEVIAGARSEADIPITKDAYTNFLKTIADIDSPVNKLFGSNIALADLLPAYSQGDANGAKLAQYLLTKYSDMLFNGMSFNFNFSYTSPAEQALANNVATAITQNLQNRNMNATASASLLQAYDINTSNNTFTKPQGTYSNGANANIFNNLTDKYFGSNSAAPNQVESPYTYSNNASQFDWHERANFICESVEKRGLNPKDFGCLRPDEYVSENFSWRGYAKMICGRLGTSMDTSLPEVCGCPPTTWSGWRP